MHQLYMFTCLHFISMQMVAAQVSKVGTINQTSSKIIIKGYIWTHFSLNLTCNPNSALELEIKGNQMDFVDGDALKFSHCQMQAYSIFYFFENNGSPITWDANLMGTRLTQVYLNDNFKMTLGDNTRFDNLTVQIIMESNGITSIPSGIFQNLSRLNTLSLKGNKLQCLPGDLFNDLISLSNLNLKSNQLIHLENGIFDGMWASITIIELDDNKLQQLTDDVLPCDTVKFPSVNALYNPLVLVPECVLARYDLKLTDSANVGQDTNACLEQLQTTVQTPPRTEQPISTSLHPASVSTSPESVRTPSTERSALQPNESSQPQPPPQPNESSQPQPPPQPNESSQPQPPPQPNESSQPQPPPQPNESGRIEPNQSNQVFYIGLVSLVVAALLVSVGIIIRRLRSS